DLDLLYIPAVLAVAAFFGRGPGLVAAGLSSLAYEFYFGDPPFSLAVDSLQDWLGLGVFLMTALVTGGLSVALRQQVHHAREREREATVLHRLDQALAGSDRIDPALAAAAGLLASEIGAPVRLEPGPGLEGPPLPGELRVPLRSGDGCAGWLGIGSVAAPTHLTDERFLRLAAGQVATALERARLRTLADQAEALRRSDDLKTSLVNSVSHEMRTPLA